MPIKALDGTPIFDAKRPLKLHINDNDIAKADVKEPMDCAAARALRREQHCAEVRVHLGRVYIRQAAKGNWTRYITPKPLRAEIIAFDRGGKFEPGEFVLIAPSKNKRVTGKAHSTKRNYRPTGKKRRAPHVVTDVRSGPA